MSLDGHDRATDPGLVVGQRVFDAEDSPPRSDGVVLMFPGVAAGDRHLDGPGSDTVADVNPRYPAEAAVAVVAFLDDLDDEHLDRIRRGDPRDVVDEVRTYDYPANRLVPARREHRRPNTDVDREADAGPAVSSNSGDSQ